MSPPSNGFGSIIPSLRYRDAPVAIDWLSRAFGFEPKIVVPGEEEGSVLHAQLELGDGMIMLGTVRGDEHGEKVGIPADLGASTQSNYVYIEDPDAHCAQAKATGARIIYECADQEYGGRLYACVDPEGHIWNFGSYNPRA